MKIAVMGSGSVGTYVGGALIAAGADVVLIGRAPMQQRIAQHGLVLTDLHQTRIVLNAAQVPYRLEAQALADADLILVTVKSTATAQAAQDIAQWSRADAVILSLQNGIGNAATLQRNLPRHTIVGGMVPFNIAQLDDGRLHRGTQGELMIAPCAQLADWLPRFAAAGLPLNIRNDFEAVQWGKLLLNLNNPLNALSGLPLKTQLSQRAWRRCLAQLIAEALTILHGAGIKPAKVVSIAPHWLPTLLRLPDFLFRRIAASMLRIDPEARSSMAEDFDAGRRTEIDFLNGAVVVLALSLGRRAPANQRIVELVHAAEQGGASTISGGAMWDDLRGR